MEGGQGPAYEGDSRSSRSCAATVRLERTQGPRAAWALAHLKTDVGIAALIEIKQHNDPRVRHAVASGLAGCEAGEAQKTLIELMEDPDDEVRNWAAFALGSLSEADSA